MHHFGKNPEVVASLEDEFDTQLAEIEVSKAMIRSQTEQGQTLEPNSYAPLEYSQDNKWKLGVVVLGVALTYGATKKFVTKQLIKMAEQ